MSNNYLRIIGNLQYVLACMYATLIQPSSTAAEFFIASQFIQVESRKCTWRLHL